MTILLDNIVEAPLVSWLVCSSLVGVAILLYQYQTSNTFTYWKKRGIDGPRPWPIVGNFVNVLIGDRMERERKWAQKYGKIYGVYQGTRPRLIVADAEVLQQICVKDFDAFPNHDVNEFFNHYQKSFLFFLQDDRWKRNRTIMSPTFTSGKIKRMFRFLDACADDLVKCFEEQIALSLNGKAEVNVKAVYNLFTMDAIATCCYGLKLERVAGSADLKTTATRNDFVQMAMKIFAFSPLRFTAYIIFPKSLLRAIGFNVSTREKYQHLAKVVTQLVEQRRSKSSKQQQQHDKKYDDYLQLLIEAKLDDEMDLNEMDLEENHHAGLTHESLIEDQRKFSQELDKMKAANKRQLVLSELEIVSQAMFLLIVGLETTSSLLSNCSYLLAFNPHIQEKLYEELAKIAEFKADDKTRTLFSYEALTSCNYLDSVLAETLRLFTPVLVSDRVSARDYYLEKYKLHLPKGTRLSTAFHAIMNDPDYWPEPEKFSPERFMPGNKEKIVPGSYCPFGIGPRHCIGMRFSLTEAKLALAKTIMKYRFERAPGTKFPPELKLSLGLVDMKRPQVMVSPRDRCN